MVHFLHSHTTAGIARRTAPSRSLSDSGLCGSQQDTDTDRSLGHKLRHSDNHTTPDNEVHGNLEGRCARISAHSALCGSGRLPSLGHKSHYSGRHSSAGSWRHTSLVGIPVRRTSRSAQAHTNRSRQPRGRFLHSGRSTSACSLPRTGFSGRRVHSWDQFFLLDKCRCLSHGDRWHLLHRNTGACSPCHSDQWGSPCCSQRRRTQRDTDMSPLWSHSVLHSYTYTAAHNWDHTNQLNIVAGNFFHGNQVHRYTPQ